MSIALHPRRRLGGSFPSSPLAGALSSLTTSVLSWPGRFIRHRRLMDQLSRMSDLELRDIGLVRQDVVDAGTVAFADDPSRVLARRAAERRLWSHG